MRNLRSKYNIQDFVGKKIGKWTILSLSHTDDKKQQYWLCKCECGLEKPVRTNHLMRGLNKGCSFCRGQAAKGTDSLYWKGGDFICMEFLTHFRLSAKRRNIPFELSIQDIENQWIKQEGKCAFTNETLTLPEKSFSFRKCNASIDRIDSFEGYNANNIQFVLKSINVMKRDMKDEDFIRLCYLTTKNRGGSCGV